MDLHRLTLPQKIDPRSGRLCQYCKKLDPNFDRRNSLDQLVSDTGSDTAWGHLTEDGHVHHRLLELSIKLGVEGADRPVSRALTAA